MNETEFLDIQNVNLQIKSECGNRKQTRNGDWRQYIEPTTECLRIHSSKLVKDTQNILNIFIKYIRFVLKKECDFKMHKNLNELLWPQMTSYGIWWSKLTG